MLVKNKKYYFDLDAVGIPQKFPEDVIRRIRQDKEDGIFPFNKNSPLARRSTAFNYRVRDAEKKSEQYPQFKATKEEIKRYRQTHYPQDQAESFGSPRARYWRKEIPYHPAGDPTIHGQRLPPQPNQEGAFHPLGKNCGDVWNEEVFEGWKDRFNASKYKLNHNFFSKIDTEEKAYWLGFLFADGNVDEKFNRITVGLSQKDELHLQLLKEVLNCDKSFEYRVYNGSLCVFFRFSSEQIKKDLLNLQIKKVECFSKISDNLLNHFIRGLFDGDGWIRYRLASNGVSTDYEVGFVNKDKNVVLKVQEIFKKISGSNSERIRAYKGGYDFAIGGRQQVEKIGNWLYQNATIYLMRKKYNFPQFVNDSSDVFEIPTQPAPPEVRGKFFALFPEKLIEPMIMAGCPAEVCKKCGQPRERISRTIESICRQWGERKSKPWFQDKREMPQRLIYESVKETVGWTDCSCEGENKYKPGIVLDLFVGSGTTCVVAKKLGRDYIGIDISPKYCEIARKRLAKIPERLDRWIS
jgi:hypothetical protein